MKRLCFSLPPRKRLLRRVQRADPNVAARILKDPEYFHSRQPLSRCVGSLRPHVRELFKRAYVGVTRNSLGRRYPPFAQMVPEYDLIPAPAPIRLSRRQVYLDGIESGAVELVDKTRLAHHADFAITVFKN